ncbi:polysaccharide deacetylase family protein [Paenibacillus aurantiacus]|uniref:Polysaccharide deacetylase family protein n=1 Tax=Paenibacillus aurantiacus TaxID=1936118 RepID=A0ABV5KJ70_9BACL
MQVPTYAVRITTTLALLACLSACGNPASQPNSQAHAESAANVKITEPQEAPFTSGAMNSESPAKEDASIKETTTPKPTNTPKPDAAKQKEQTKPLYTMNAAYRFEPIAGTGAAKKAVLLTFDDGPKDKTTLTAMLDTLDKHQAKAIFFVNGYRVKAKPELLKLIASRGQTIGNHSWDHIDLKKEDESTVRKQIGDVQSIVKETIGQTPRFFRPPFGSGGDVVKQIARDSGMLFMTWSNGSLDWDASSKDKPEKVISNVMEQLHPGANILMHELPWTKNALDSLLTKLEEKGYGFIDPATIDSVPKPKATRAK